ncbi:MAG: phage major capsid protein [Sulfuritalea sp.]|nr:phage major capsid protein [Sulfuritalea sp.]
MNSTKFLWGLTIALVAVAALAVGAGVFDLDTAIAGVTMAEGVAVADLKALEKAMKDAFDQMGVNLRKAQEVADNALAESKKYGGVIEAKTNDKLKEIDENRIKVQDEVLAIRAQVLEVAQKLATVPQGGSGAEQKALHELIVESDAWKANQGKANPTKMDPVTIGTFHYRGARFFNAPITNPNPLTNDQPLVPAERVPGIITPAEQRLYIRDLLPQARATSNLIEFASEATFTSNARPQGDTSPVGHGEGEQKAESAFTFTLSNAPVVTVAHWIPASRQVLSDASFLQGHLSTRLLYGLKLEEEQELLTGTGAAGELNGLNNQAAAYSQGVTNDTILDTLLKAILQVSLSNYEASAFVLHPTNWYAAMLLKDTTNRYLFSDPQSMVAPRVWAKPVVASQTQTLGRFLAGAFSMGAQIWDKEDATVRISENVNDHFIRNMVAILCEERLALTIYRTTAFVYGNTSHDG